MRWILSQYEVNSGSESDRLTQYSVESALIQYTTYLTWLARIHAMARTTLTRYIMKENDAHITLQLQKLLGAVGSIEFRKASAPGQRDFTDQKRKKKKKS